MQLAAKFIYSGHAAGGVHRIGRTAAAAIHSGKTIITLLVGVDVAQFKLIPSFFIGDTFKYITQQVLFLSRKLMAGIQIAVGGYRQVLRSHTTAGNSLHHAGASLQIQHIMIESKALALFLAL